ncbi:MULTISPECIES: hypothetical protein [unclassified Microcoleus]|uniref:hypothetical protein n=1 Tax=unclassified Microcoleus TaxID=2642155 RepID=UPI001DBF15BA|nr:MULTISPECIES: hypothetical protein [unclassified Microcoleus]MCC3443379.1 hypothetical protein [Microcoleus sp. PH2017_03_ELD_O_A]MCC3464454.1 hypothetical protein [Microcoleus sp. PH2017_06_SFM_O_A]MCC3502783.1 hypothetical protein [Microcoleus sp. PH2017_19_SFW_U_A]MCC3509816.1 hypothetical protein [Microcoleus sp. PH2017_17_BER_D_A]MCC3550161.1 hypothetical protein [Microcoleus sp. PH2017_24_DOB_U_A]MCC3568512.1 hypothetical protein [Microcoleus sp. PH2017_31_RDM_U_A]MCC3583827.1 hypot
MNRLILISPDRDSGFKPILFGHKTSVTIEKKIKGIVCLPPKTNNSLFLLTND